MTEKRPFVLKQSVTTISDKVEVLSKNVPFAIKDSACRCFASVFTLTKKGEALHLKIKRAKLFENFCNVIATACCSIDNNWNDDKNIDT